MTAADGQEAYEIACRQLVELVIADIRMPLMDGLTLIRRLRVRHPETHYILISA
ncbi:MAG: response regulator [Clostridia bacterium]|nr:response regulator [Clostridia bacterium]